MKNDKNELDKWNIARREALLIAKERLAKYQINTEQMNESINSLQQRDNYLSKNLSRRRQYLIAELLSFFPLNPVSESECAIVNIRLPNNCSIWPGMI